MIKEAIEKIVSKQDLTYEEAYTVMNEIMNGETTQVQNAAYLAALSTKSTKAETIPEISGSAAAMREHALPVRHDGFDVLEIVGTGGDHTGSINVSTTASIITSAAGIHVAKHGNRAASSKSGAADVLEALGVKIDLPPEKCEALLRNLHFCFMFAQVYHSSMKHVGAVRKELGIRTVFNILGPLTNPAKPDRILLGVYDPHLLEPLTKVLIQLGLKRGMVVHGTDGFDEISVSAPTLVSEFNDGWYKTYTITPEDFGIETGEKADTIGGTPAENAAITRAILEGKETGTKADFVLLNAAAAIYIGGKASSFHGGIAKARELISSGVAVRQLNDFIAYSNR